MFRLFLKEHAAFIIFQLFLVAFIMLIYWLDGLRNMDTAIYSIVISLVLILTFLAIRFSSRYKFYQKISQPPQTMEEALQKDGKSPVQMQGEAYLQNFYRLYQQEVQELYASQKRQLQFMNQWVHQMKTPLSVMELLLQEEGELDKQSVRAELDRLKAGLDTVLMNARLETFEEDMQIEQVPLLGLLQEAVSENKRLFISKRVYPEISIDESFIVPTDRKWMKFVIGQFLTNAVKYTFEPNKKVKILAACKEGTVILKIQDEGIGIPASDLARIRKPFFTGENGRKTGESTGMGLYLADEVCKKLGHQLDISSTPGEGTTVSVLFRNQDQSDEEDRHATLENRRHNKSVRRESDAQGTESAQL